VPGAGDAAAEPDRHDLLITSFRIHALRLEARHAFSARALTRQTGALRDMGQLLQFTASSASN
jgi:hypothetical protein